MGWVTMGNFGLCGEVFWHTWLRLGATSGHLRTALALSVKVAKSRQEEEQIRDLQAHGLPPVFSMVLLGRGLVWRTILVRLGRRLGAPEFILAPSRANLGAILVSN